MCFASVKVVGDDSEVTGQCYRSQKRNDPPHRLKVILHAINVFWILLLERKKRRQRSGIDKMKYRT